MSRLLLCLLVLQVPYVASVCQDNIATCPDLKAYCSSDINVQMQCQKTCGNCIDVDCKDQTTMCSGYTNFCDQESIKTACPMTCGLCPTPTPTTLPCIDTSPVCPVISAQCADETVKQTCPMTCGVCAPVVECVDHLVTCPQYTQPCSENMKLECPLTCGACDARNATTATPTTRPTTVLLVTTPEPTTIRPTTKLVTVPKTTTTKKATPKPPCKDNSPNCATWAKNGFCTNNFYSKEQKMEYCAKTCRLC